MKRCLIVDDDPPLLLILAKMLKGRGYEVVTAGNGSQAIKVLGDQTFDLVLTDVMMQPVNGMELLSHVRTKAPYVPVVVMTACEDLDTAVKAMRAGAFDYVVKPLRIPEVMETVQRALEYRDRHDPGGATSFAGGHGPLRLGAIVAASPVMQKACETMERLALTNASLLIGGESGTGKSLAARAMHDSSHRRAAAFVVVDCRERPEETLEAAIFGRTGGPAPLVVQAHMGTLFLHEVPALPRSIQQRLAGVLVDKKLQRPGASAPIPVDVRVIASCTDERAMHAETGLIQSELFYRVGLIQVVIAPLRERREDILPLAFQFLHRESENRKKKLRLSGEAQVALSAYRWPGNVHEVEQAICLAAEKASGQVVEVTDLPANVVTAGASAPAGRPGAKADSLRGRMFSAFLREKERNQIRLLLEQMGGDKHKVAEALGIPVTAVDRKLQGGGAA